MNETLTARTLKKLQMHWQ